MLSKFPRILSILSTFVFILAGFGFAQAAPIAELESLALSEQAESSCSNLDVIFIVDQSDSMSGASGGRANDPTIQRKNAVEGMIDLLVDLSLDQCPDSYHRLGIISFGNEGQSQVDLNLTDINPRNPQDAQELRGELKSKVLATALGQTYPEEAFDKAWEMFEFSAAAGDDEPRKRVILFITDGFPCLDGECNPNRYEESTTSLRNLIDDRFDFTENLKKREACLARLRDTYGDDEIPAAESTACLEQNDVPDGDYQKSTYIFTILLRNSGENTPTRAQDILDTMSQNYSGQLIALRRNAEDIPTTLRKILSQLAGVRPNLLDCGQFAVNPYLKKALITAYKTSEDVQIKLSYIDAENNTHVIQGGGPADGFELAPDTGYYVFGANERYDILNPYPGIWSLESTNCDGIDVYYDEVEILPKEYAPLSQIPQYDREPYYNRDDPFYLEYQLQDSSTNGAVISQSAKELFIINVLTQVTAPDGTETTYALKWNSASQTFRAEKPLLVPLEGTYKYTITGTTLRHDGNPIINTENETQVFNQEQILFSVENVEFSALDVVPVQVLPVSPLIGAQVGNVHDTILGGWPLKELPLAIRVKIIDENGVTLTNVSEVLATPENSIQATLKYSPTPSPQQDGILLPDQVSQPITLIPDPENPGEFVGSIAEFAYEGSHILTLDISSESLARGYWVYDRSIDVSFTRTDCLLCRAVTYYVILGIIIAIILIIIAYNIAIRTNKVSGSLIFMDGSENIAEFGLYNGINFRTIRPRELDGYPQLALKSMKIQNIGKKKRVNKQQDEMAGGFYSDDAQGVRVDCVSSAGRKFSVELYPKTPTIYSDETMAQMLYESVE